MAIDVHIHTHGDEDGAAVLAALDQIGLERAVLFAVPPHRHDWGVAASDRRNSCLI